MDVLGLKPELWLPLLAGALGGLLVALSGWLKDYVAYRIERTKREEDRRAALLQRRAEMQRAALLVSQEQLATFFDAARKWFYENSLITIRTGQWKSEPLPEGLYHDFNRAHFALLSARAKVADETAHNLISIVARLGMQMSASSDPKEAEAIQAAMIGAAAQAVDAIGVALREIDKVEEALLAVNRPLPLK